MAFLGLWNALSGIPGFRPGQSQNNALNILSRAFSWEGLLLDGVLSSKLEILFLSFGGLADSLRSETGPAEARRSHPPFHWMCLEGHLEVLWKRPGHSLAATHFQLCCSWKSPNVSGPGRIKHAPNCGHHHFVSPSALFSRRGVGPSPILEVWNLPFFVWRAYYFCKISEMSPLFPSTGNGWQKVTRNGGPRIGACLTLSEP